MQTPADELVAYLSEGGAIAPMVGIYVLVALVGLAVRWAIYAGRQV